MNQSVHLVIGSDGVVGGALLRRLKNTGESVAGTTRRHGSEDELNSYLDLSDNVDHWGIPRNVGVATVCAGITKAQACKDDPASTSTINVQGISTLVANLVAAGVFVIFLSTNQVFDGSVAHQAPDAPLSPITEYGRQKAEVERRLAQYGRSVAIVRFAKILGPNPALIPGWIDSLRSGRPIHPFSYMTLAPLPLSCAVTVLALIARLRLSGIHQVTGQEDISYAEAARIGAISLGLDPHLVQPIAAAEQVSYTEPIPAYTSLNIDRLKATLGVVPPSVSWTIQTAFANPQLLEGA